jgi:hypothetical protein
LAVGRVGRGRTIVPGVIIGQFGVDRAHVGQRGRGLATASQCPLVYVLYRVVYVLYRVGAHGVLQRTDHPARPHHQGRPAGVRTALVEAAWHYRHTPKVGVGLARRHSDLSAATIAQSRPRGRRRNTKFRHMLGHGKVPSVAVTGVARELAGFVWAEMTVRQHPDRRSAWRPSLPADRGAPRAAVRPRSPPSPPPGRSARPGNDRTRPATPGPRNSAGPATGGARPVQYLPVRQARPCRNSIASNRCFARFRSAIKSPRTRTRSPTASSAGDGTRIARQLPGPIQPGQARGVPPVSLDPIPAALRNQRRSDHLTGHPQAPQQPVQLITTRTRLITGPQRTDIITPTDQPPHRLLAARRPGRCREPAHPIARSPPRSNPSTCPSPDRPDHHSLSNWT